MFAPFGILLFTGMLYGNSPDATFRSGDPTLALLYDTASLTPQKLRTLAASLLPVGLSGGVDTLFLPQRAGHGPYVYIDSAEVDPVQVTMGLLRSGQGRKIPAFRVRAAFELTTAPSMRMPPRGSILPLLLPFPAGRYSDSVNTPPVVADPFVPGAKMELTIIAYPGRERYSTIEFVASMLDDRFDNVWRVSDLSRFEATAVRCRQRSVFWNMTATYFAIVAFDAGIYYQHNQCVVAPLPKKPQKGALPVRYLITLKADGDIENKAEHILQGVLAKFEQSGWLGQGSLR
jgi:hypothetical protein